MGDAEQEDSDESAEPAEAAEQDNPAARRTEPGATARAAESNASPPVGKTTHVPHDRYIAPEMQSYTPVYRVGHQLILPAAINNEKLKLFILDTGASSTSISPQAAREVTKVRSDDNTSVEGISGKVKRVYSADDVTFRFAHLSQKVRDVISFDTSEISKDSGMEISGFLGATTLGLLTMQIDYRDGLVKFDYDPKRGYQF
jgi:hypothetical protein